MDHVTVSERSRMMSKVPSRHSTAEIQVRKILHRLGYRFRLHRPQLPGTPDIVLPKYRGVVFVNGCFWHGHSDCPKGRLPKTRVEYWANKIEKNKERDSRTSAQLSESGWNVVVIWQCELRDPEVVVSRLTKEFVSPTKPER